MLYFVYHLAHYDGRAALGLSPCPEFDLSFICQDMQPTMHVISPPLSISAAHRAMTDAAEAASGGLLSSFYSVRKSLAIYGVKAKMPPRPRRVAAAEQAPTQLVSGIAEEMATKLRGRMLLMREISALMPSAGPTALAMAAQYCKMHFGVEILPGIMYRGYGGRICVRCGSTTGFAFSQCQSCGCGQCLQCSECQSLGAVRECEPLLALAGGERMPFPWAVHEPRMKYGLTRVQKEASEGICSWLSGEPGDEALVWAVCGAGKTEVSFAAMASSLNSGMRVLYAAPRRDVVAELTGRIADTFPRASCSSYYSGSMLRSGKPTDITIATTHQAIRFHKCFDLTVLDEVDAFPYQGSRMLEHAVRNARSKAGRTLFMSATPSRALLNAAENGRIHTERISARHHRRALPVPAAIRLGAASKQLLGGKSDLPQPIKDALIESFEGGYPHFVFVPRRAVAEPLADAVSRFLKEAGHSYASVGWSHSQDPGREQKRMSFTEGRMDVLVCTSIMERGVTVPGCDVSVIGSDLSEIFDYRALVQMAGRAGRQAARPTGSVRFFCCEASRDMEEAIDIIEGMNADAKSKGYID